jgi:hypothetical protein
LTIVGNDHTSLPEQAQNLELFLGKLFEIFDTTFETEFGKEGGSRKADGASPKMGVKEGQDEPHSVDITAKLSRLQVIEELDESNSDVTKPNPRKSTRRMHLLRLQSPKGPSEMSKLVSPAKTTLATEGRSPRESKKQGDDPFDSGYEMMKEKLKRKGPEDAHTVGQLQSVRNLGLRGLRVGEAT